MGIRGTLRALVCLVSLCLAPAAVADCASRFLRGDDALSYLLLNRPRLRIATANLLKLVEREDEYGFPRIAKSKEHLRAQADALLAVDADILVVQETDRRALAKFNRGWLGKRYRVSVVDGRGPKRIQVGVLVRRDLPLAVEERAFRDERWGERGALIFERTVPGIVVRLRGDTRPLFAGLGVPLKSKNGDPVDSDGTLTRMTQAMRLVDIAGRYFGAHGDDLPFFVAGDFNGNPNEEMAFEPLARAGLVDAFARVSLPVRARVTHSFHPGPIAQYQQLDAVLLSRGFAPYLRRAWVHRFLGADGRAKRLPRSAEERDANPSDHFPVVIEIDLARLLIDRVISN